MGILWRKNGYGRIPDGNEDDAQMTTRRKS